MSRPCSHQNMINQGIEARTPEGCEECLKSGDSWVTLRKCLTCGHIGCCDSSPNKHARKHFKKTGHAVVESYKSETTWRWCYADNTYLE